MMINRLGRAAFVLLAIVNFGRAPARADLYSLRTSGTISSSSDATIPNGTPFHFELTYDTDAPDHAPGDATFGVYANSSSPLEPPAMVFFHYQAGSYEATLDDAEDFGLVSDMLITFTSVNAIDVNIIGTSLFPPLGGGSVGFHADFNAFTTPPIFTSDGLPTNTAIDAASFGESSVTLLPTSGFITGSVLTSFSISAVEQPTTAGDYNNDGVVDAADYVVWRRNVGTTNALVNDNGIGGVVGQLQYDLWRSRFGLHVAASAAVIASGPVPEPGNHLLVMLAVLGAWTRRGR